MSYQIKEDMHDLAIYDDLVNILITLKVKLENIHKISIVKVLEINNKIKNQKQKKLMN